MASVISQINKYKISRRGRKLQISDDARTLVALPREVAERTWAEILLKEENDLIVYDIREEILEETLRIAYERYMERQNALFSAHCAAQAWLKLIDWHFYRHDPGEEPSAAPACFIPKRAESWEADTLPEPCPKDSWGSQKLQVVEDTPDEGLVRWPSNSSIDMPVVEDIPEEYWFPGKVNLPDQRSKEEKAETTVSYDNRNKPLVVRVDVSGVWNYVQQEASVSEDLAADSELLQKVTDYSTVDLSPKDSTFSALKTTTPVDGSLQGAGDSTVGGVRTRRKMDKSKSFSKASVTGRSRSRLLPALDKTDSRSRISIISDCRLRNLRMMMGLPRFCSASTMFAEARVDGFHAIIRKKTASLLSRVRGSSNSILQVIPDRYDLPVMKAFIRVLIK